MKLKRFENINESEEDITAADKQFEEVDPNSMEAHITKVLKPLIDEVKNDSYKDPSVISDAEVLGLIVSKYHRWDGGDIAETAKSAFIDANYDDMDKEIVRKT